MVISDLEHLEDVREEEENQVKGGAVASANALAVAVGEIAVTSTATFSGAASGSFFVSSGN